MKKVLLILLMLGFWVGAKAQKTVSKAERLAPTTFAKLGTPNDGDVRYCSDCAATAPCTGSGTGADAYRVAGTWNCNTGAGAAGTVTTTGSPASGNITKFSGPTSITNAAAGTDYVAPGGALGTPSSGTLTNATGLPESGLSLADITTNDVSITKHGLAPKLPNDVTKFLNGIGTYTAPAGGPTANPTVGAIPYLSAANVFSDSPLTRVNLTDVNIAAGGKFGDGTNYTLYYDGGGSNVYLRNGANSAFQSFRAASILSVSGGFFGDVHQSVSNTDFYIAVTGAVTSYPLMSLRNTGQFCFASGSNANAPDTCFGRNAAGVVEINNGSAGALRDLTLRNVTAANFVGNTIGTPAAPAIRLNSQTDTGFFSGGNQFWYFSAGGGVQAGIGRSGTLNGLALPAGDTITWASDNDLEDNGDSGISRIGPKQFAFGSATAGDFSGTVKAATVNGTTNVFVGSPGVPSANNTAVLAFSNNTSKPTLAANTSALYQKTGEQYVQDSAGNETLISPHDFATGEWVFKSSNEKTGHALYIRTERLLKVLADRCGKACDGLIEESGSYALTQTYQWKRSLFWFHDEAPPEPPSLRSGYYAAYKKDGRWLVETPDRREVALEPADMGGTKVLTPTPGATVTLAIDATVKHTICSWTAGEAESIVISGTPADGNQLTLIVLNDGILPRVLTSSTGLSGLGVVTGVASKRSTISFIALSGVFYETSRTVGF